ncbi:MAG: tryptophan halogenase family protein [Burkholderiales bacterium]
MQLMNLSKVVIVGGGTAGWMTAAALSQVLKPPYSIHLIESDEIGIVGVGEATIPMIRRFNNLVGIDEQEFMRETQGTFKLGIEFVNWGRLGDRYMHGFGRIGQDLWPVGFEQYWLRMRAKGMAEPLEAYSITRMASKANKFMPPSSEVPDSPLNDIAYAYHFDAGLYARYLRRICEARGVLRVEGKIVKVEQEDGSGHVRSLKLANGKQVDGELFIDCSGMRGVLIEQTLETGFEDWTHWLPCDRALAVPCESVSPLLPFTRSTAHSAGWQWRIPLQHRIGNGHVYSSRYLSDDEAAATLLAHLDGRPMAEPRLIKFTTGMRKAAWSKNVVAVGLSSGFLEPLESTSIHLIQAAISKLIEFFPHKGFDPVDVAEFNRQNRFHYERIRDFIILHYHLNQREDSAFWRDCAQMSSPETLQHKINLYKASGRLLRVDNELFTEVGWLQVMEGQNLQAKDWQALANQQDEEETAAYLKGVASVIASCVSAMPTHEAYIAAHCKAQ